MWDEGRAAYDWSLSKNTTVKVLAVHPIANEDNYLFDCH
jgi:hypothetical protein